jgi:hypothetical protein
MSGNLSSPRKNAQSSRIFAVSYWHRVTNVSPNHSPKRHNNNLVISVSSFVG